jgi:hypothetical protein
LQGCGRRLVIASKIEDEALRVLERFLDVNEEGDGVFAVD